MIFAELQYEGHYDGLHAQLLAFLASHFEQLESGHQSDSYIWILDGGEKVAVDTFTSMKHQVKSAAPGKHVQDVIRALQLRYPLDLYDPPLPEAHEDI